MALAMKACIFCKIVSGEVPAERVFEDEDMIVIPDKFPSAPVHLLFVSRAHGEEFHKTDEGKLTRMLRKVREKALELAMSYRIAMNGAGASQIHDHLHIHLLGQVAHDRPV